GRRRLLGIADAAVRGAVLRRGALERAGHAADAVDEIAGQVYGFARLDVRQLMQELAEDRPQLRPGQVRTQAEVHAAAAEADVRIGVAAQVKALGMLEHVGVVVARGVEHHHFLASPDGLPADLDILCGRAAERHYRAGPADE